MKHIIPFGDRILVRRKVTGEKIGKEGIIIATDHTADTVTDIATVVFVPDHSFADNELISNASAIVSSLGAKAQEGSAEALKALLEFNIYLKIKSISVGDEVMISKYVGTTFHDNKGGGSLTLVEGHDVIGIVEVSE